ncbi:MAG TPA: hypothetical protein PKC40_04575 [Saprospiraceae bacterium]|nr:hypothetical protein [Saprospiraceae bacterium]
MNSILISPKTKAQFKLISDLLDEMNIEKSILTEEEKEDIGLALAMREADRSKKVSLRTIKLHS